MGSELSDFEKQRLANIAERDALLKKLTQEAQSSGLFPPKLAKASSGDTGKAKKKPPPRRLRKKRKLPCRAARLRG
ncbi:hypothetical protein AWENTII_004892 [Aspergillus wentii]